MNDNLQENQFDRPKDILIVLKYLLLPLWPKQKAAFIGSNMLKVLTQAALWQFGRISTENENKLKVPWQDV